MNGSIMATILRETFQDCEDNVHQEMWNEMVRWSVAHNEHKCGCQIQAGKRIGQLCGRPLRFRAPDTIGCVYHEWYRPALKWLGQLPDTVRSQWQSKWDAHWHDEKAKELIQDLQTSIDDFARIHHCPNGYPPRRFYEDEQYALYLTAVSKGIGANNAEQQIASYLRSSLNS